jgi:hypothetical protein
VNSTHFIALASIPFPWTQAGSQLRVSPTNNAQLLSPTNNAQRLSPTNNAQRLSPTNNAQRLSPKNSRCLPSNSSVRIEAQSPKPGPDMTLISIKIEKEDTLPGMLFVLVDCINVFIRLPFFLCFLIVRLPL